MDSGLIGCHLGLYTTRSMSNCGVLDLAKQSNLTSVNHSLRKFQYFSFENYIVRESQYLRLKSEMKLGRKIVNS